MGCNYEVKTRGKYSNTLFQFPRFWCMNPSFMAIFTQASASLPPVFVHVTRFKWAFCLLQRSPFVRAAINTSWTASSSKCWTVTGTASAWSAATVRRSWLRNASAEATASTAKRISSSKARATHTRTRLWWNHSLRSNLVSPKEVRDQMCRVSAGDSTHAGGEEGAGLRLPPPLFRLHRVQKAAGHRWRVLPDGGQQAGVQDGLRDSQTERWGSIPPPGLRSSAICAPCARQSLWYTLTVTRLTRQWGQA